MADTPQMPALPEVDLRMQIPYDSIRYVAGFHEGYVKQYAVVYAQAHAAQQVREALAGCRELLDAASNYANRYAQDEAADEGPYYTGCSEQQHEDAKRLFAAIRALAAEIQPPQKADQEPSCK